MNKEYFVHRGATVDKYDFWRYGNSLGKKLDDMEVKCILENISKESFLGTILDIGCGTGYHLKKVSENRKFSQFVGIDYSESYIKKAKTNFPNACFTAGSYKKIQKIDFESDLTHVMMIGLLQYLSEEQTYDLSSILSTVMKEGSIIIKHPVYFGEKGYTIETVREGFKYTSHYKTFDEIVKPFMKNFKVKSMKRIFEKKDFTTQEFSEIDSAKGTQQMLIVLDKF